MAVATQPLKAEVINQIVLTENSSTSLTATYNGSTSGVTVTFLGDDLWNVTFPASVTFSLFGGVNWLEPGSTTQGNEVTFFTPPSHTLSVISDFQLAGLTTVGNGITVNNVGTDSINGGSISATFNDNGDVASAPDTGSTLGLLAVALAGLIGASRFRSIRLA